MTPFGIFWHHITPMQDEIKHTTTTPHLKFLNYLNKPIDDSLIQKDN